jgi:hypothetical protein
LREFLKSAKGADARRQTVEELASPSGGAFDTATVLRVFLRKIADIEVNLESRFRAKRQMLPDILLMFC